MTRFHDLVQTGRAGRASGGAGGSMRNTLSMVAVGIGLLSPGCNQARKADTAGASMAERVEGVAAPSPALRSPAATAEPAPAAPRSEERRVGTDCESRGRALARQ